jgi:D-alanyl-D-alanine carboxypeptidase/D-alanyl-D-alanine-endopeptidase (penicillin-binding protein 4)
VKRTALALAAVVFFTEAGPSGPAVRSHAGSKDPASIQLSLVADLDKIFSAPAIARALVGVRMESLRDGLLYEKNGAKLVVPASNMKLLTVVVAAERLGWDYRFETRFEAAGSIQDGGFQGDLIVTGTGDPSIGSPDGGPAALFLEWADALRQAGVRRVTGRLIGDDRAFDNDGLGAGWAWDYVAAAYAAPVGALSFNENAAVLRISPGAEAGGPATIAIAPAGHGLVVINEVRTGAAGTPAIVDLGRLPGSPTLTVRGSLPLGRAPLVRATAVDNPTQYFVEALRVALAQRGITVSGGAFDIADVRDAPAGAPRRLIARRESLPLSALAAHCLKESQNFYGETFLKAIGRSAGRQGTAAGGRALVRETLAAWGIAADAFVMNDGSGLSRYDYVTADAIVALLKHAWEDEKLRGPFVAALPIGGRDGTLDTRMKNSPLDGRVQAKTGTIANMRALSGFLTTNSGEKIVFSIIANHFTAPSAEIDAIAEQALARLVGR